MAAAEELFRDAFGSSFATIVVTELGDKTFFIAALLAMRHARLPVFLGAAGALAAMTVLSAAMGLVLPALLPRQYTHWAAVVFFFYVGFKLIREAAEMVRNGEGIGPSGELEEVEQSLKEEKHNTSVALQALTMTFLAEWGDRSQFATIALATSKPALWVTLGGVLGHCCCTGLAVMGGRVLAAKFSERLIVGCGGMFFLAFAAHGTVWGAVA